MKNNAPTASAAPRPAAARAGGSAEVEMDRRGMIRGSYRFSQPDATGERVPGGRITPAVPSVRLSSWHLGDALRGKRCVSEAAADPVPPAPVATAMRCFAKATRRLPGFARRPEGKALLRRAHGGSPDGVGTGTGTGNRTQITGFGDRYTIHCAMPAGNEGRDSKSPAVTVECKPPWYPLTPRSAGKPRNGMGIQQNRGADIEMRNDEFIQKP